MRQLAILARQVARIRAKSLSPTHPFNRAWFSPLSMRCLRPCKPPVRLFSVYSLRVQPSIRPARARVGGQNPTEGGHTGRYLECHRWLNGTCQALRPIGRLPTVLGYWASACTRPTTAWLTLSVSSCAVDAVNSPAGYLPCWAEVDAATARSRARMAPSRCPLSASDMRESRCVLNYGYNYITLF